MPLETRTFAQWEASADAFKELNRQNKLVRVHEGKTSRRVYERKTHEAEERNSFMV